MNPSRRHSLVEGLALVALVGALLVTGYTPKAIAQTDPDPAALPVPSCEQPELWLAFYPRADVESHFCSECSEQCLIGLGQSRLVRPLFGTPDMWMPCTEAEFLAFMEQENTYDFTRRTWVAHSSSSIAEDAVSERQTRTIGVYPGHPLVSCVWDMCEGYESIHFTIDADGQIVALSVSASG